MKELLDLGLLLAAFSLTILCVASFWIPKALGWKEKLAGLTPLMRELFWTYSPSTSGAAIFSLRY